MRKLYSYVHMTLEGPLYRPLLALLSPSISREALKKNWPGNFWSCFSVPRQPQFLRSKTTIASQCSIIE
ncbi:hypothetical protein L596_009996 [Steinernema carpocapsae]|uniref:Uncharacterized protein n=1 Tax=Steinernema carpocapsae TaxID=34508 RepID=A0A4U5PHH1_STECR|nr:hypothetical protein L596_009996 [Steinernema carpocapsae]